MNVSVELDDTDQQVLAVYVQFAEGESVRTIEIEDGAAVLDIGADRTLLGVEILALSHSDTIVDTIVAQFPDHPGLASQLHRALAAITVP